MNRSNLDRFPPAYACDCHVHVIGPKQRFPLAAPRSYTPKDAPVETLSAVQSRLGLDRVVLVQPSFYGADNACLLEAMHHLPASRAVAVLPATTGPTVLDALHAHGVRGLRVNIATAGTASLDDVRASLAATTRLCERHGWHVQIFAAAEIIEALAPELCRLPVECVIDHFGLLRLDAPDSDLAMLSGLLDSGRIWLKISGAYRIADDPADFGIDPLVQRLCAVNPQRIVWGSDWPHTPSLELRKPNSDEELPFQDIDTFGLLRLLLRWLDPAQIEDVLVHNPARLYDFP